MQWAVQQGQGIPLEQVWRVVGAAEEKLQDPAKRLYVRAHAGCMTIC